MFWVLCLLVNFLKVSTATSHAITVQSYDWIDYSPTKKPRYKQNRGVYVAMFTYVSFTSKGTFVSEIQVWKQTRNPPLLLTISVLLLKNYVTTQVQRIRTYRHCYSYFILISTLTWHRHSSHSIMTLFYENVIINVSLEFSFCRLMFIYSAEVKHINLLLWCLGMSVSYQS